MNKASNKFQVTSNKKLVGFTLLELVISIGLFLIAITVALFATVGSSGLISRTDARSVVAEGGRTINDTLRRLVDNAGVNNVETLKVSDGSVDYVGVRVKTFSIDQNQKVCQVVGRATATMANGEEQYELDDNGLAVALWVYPLSDTNLCPGLATSVLYQNRLIASSARVTSLQFSLQDINCQVGCTLTQQLRYRFRIETTLAQSGKTGESRQPSVDVISSLPIGLITLPGQVGGDEEGSNLQVNTNSLPNGTNGVAYSQTLTASGGDTPYTWSIVAGNLPTGITLNLNSGLISGTPTEVGQKNFTVRVLDSSSTTADKALSIVIDPAQGSLNITTTTLPSGLVNRSYSQTLQATGGIQPYSWSIVSGSLPAGLSLSSNGLISGTPTTPGTASFTVSVTDSGQGQAEQSDTQNLSITITTVTGGSGGAGGNGGGNGGGL